MHHVSRHRDILYTILCIHTHHRFVRLDFAARIEVGSELKALYVHITEC
jgi:hypothetical protein